MKSSLLKLGLMGMISAMTLAGAAFAQEIKVDGGATGKIESSERIPIKITPLEIAEADTQASVGSATFGSLTLTVQVDPKYCGTGGVQCTGPGLSTTFPADNNRNPVRLGLQVLQGTTPVTTLTDLDINVLNNFVPAGGSAVNQIACGACFQNAGNGMYAIFVAPGVGQTWKPGSYFVQVQVKVGVETHRALAQIEIPF
jgi:hypothetical protein